MMISLVILRGFVFCGRIIMPVVMQNLLKSHIFRPCILKAVKPSVNLLCPGYYQTRTYSKSKDKKKEKSKKYKVHINEEEIAELISVNALKHRLDTLVEELKQEYVKQLSLRTSVGALEQLPVELEGDEYPLYEVAQLARKSSQLLVISCTIFPQAAGNILKTLQDSGMNLNPQQEGTTIYISLPKVTREHREKLAKNAKAMANKCKDDIREVQNSYVKMVKRKEGVSEDLIYSVQQQIMALATEYVHQAEALTEIKQSELLGDK